MGRYKIMLQAPVAVLIAISVLMSGCMVGPNYVRPTAPAEVQWLETKDPKVQSGRTVQNKWWQVLKDPILDQLVAQAYQENLPLRAAGVRIMEARAALGIAVGRLYPQLQQATASYTRATLSRNAPNIAILDRHFGLYSVGFDAAWEIDLWGKFRRGVEAGLANLDASVANYDDVLRSLIAEVARTYVLLRTLEERLVYAKTNAKIQARGLEIAKVRYEGGMVTDLDVQQAKSLLENTLSLIPQFEAGIRQSKNALCILLGTVPGQLDAILKKPQPIPAVPVKVAVGIPADLLRRRPDIRRAERQVATQSARIGIAKADLFPHFTLLGSIGFSTADSAAGILTFGSFSNLFDSQSFRFFAGPSLSWDIFNYGRLKNRVRVQDARFQQLVVLYRQTVLQAYQEVEDAMVGFLRTQDRVGHLSSSVTAAKRSVHLSLIQYTEGIVDYQRVLDSQRELTNQQDLLASNTGSVVINLIALYKGLGGGWEIRAGKDFVPAKTKGEMRQRVHWGRLISRDQQDLPPEKKGKVRLPDF